MPPTVYKKGPLRDSLYYRDPYSRSEDSVNNQMPNEVPDQNPNEAPPLCLTPDCAEPQHEGSKYCNEHRCTFVYLQTVLWPHLGPNVKRGARCINMTNAGGHCETHEIGDNLCMGCCEKQGRIKHNNGKWCKECFYIAEKYRRHLLKGGGKA